MDVKELEAKIYGFCLGDGWLSKIKQGRHDSYFYHIGFSGDRDSLAGPLKKDLYVLFDNIGRGTIHTKNTESKKYGIRGETSYLILNTACAKHFLSLGMGTGKKVETTVVIPDWIMCGDVGTKESFLSGWYAAEGYTPSFQKNNTTLRPLGFRFHKRKANPKDKEIIVNQFSQILCDVGIEYNYFEKTKMTSHENYDCEFVFKNSMTQLIHQLSIISPTYCIQKDNKFKKCLLYYLFKNKTYLNIELARELSIKNNDISATDISKMFGVPRNNIYKWRKHKTKVGLPKKFPTFEEFI